MFLTNLLFWHQFNLKNEFFDESIVMTSDIRGILLRSHSLYEFLQITGSFSASSVLH